MKKILLISVALVLSCAVCYTVIGQRQQTLSPKQERRVAREKRRAERQADFE